MTRIITVASGKGGVGKTCLAISVSHALARRGRRVLLVDGDLGLANVDVQLGLSDGADLAMFIAGGKRLEDIVRPIELTGFDLVPGRSGSGRLAGLDDDVVDRLGIALRGIAERYDVVVLDLAAGIDTTTRKLANIAQSALVVTNEEPTSLTDAYAFLKVACRNGLAPSIVVNMAANHADGQRTFDTLRRTCASFLGLEVPLAGIIHRDNKVGDAIRHQMPLLTRHPQARASRDIEALAAALP